MSSKSVSKKLIDLYEFYVSGMLKGYLAGKGFGTIQEGNEVFDGMGNSMSVQNAYDFFLNSVGKSFRFFELNTNDLTHKGVEYIDKWIIYNNLFSKPRDNGLYDFLINLQNKK